MRNQRRTLEKMEIGLHTKVVLLRIREITNHEANQNDSALKKQKQKN